MTDHSGDNSQNKKPTYPVSIGPIFLAELISIISIIFSAGALCITYYVGMVKSPEVITITKQIDVQMHCNARWADLFKARLDIERMGQDLSLKTVGVSQQFINQATADYYRQFWSLQNDQFFYYEEGFLPENLYITWAKERVHEFASNDSVGGVTFTQGWEKYSNDFTGPPQEFLNFIEFLRKNKDHKFDADFEKAISYQLGLASKAFPNSPLYKRHPLAS